MRENAVRIDVTCFLKDLKLFTNFELLLMMRYQYEDLCYFISVIMAWVYVVPKNG